MKMLNLLMLVSLFCVSGQVLGVIYGDDTSDLFTTKRGDVVLPKDKTIIPQVMVGTALGPVRQEMSEPKGYLKDYKDHIVLHSLPANIEESLQEKAKENEAYDSLDECKQQLKKLSNPILGCIILNTGKYRIVGVRGLLRPKTNEIAKNTKLPGIVSKNV